MVASCREASHDAGAGSAGCSECDKERLLVANLLWRTPIDCLPQTRESALNGHLSHLPTLRNDLLADAVGELGMPRMLLGPRFTGTLRLLKYSISPSSPVQRCGPFGWIEDPLPH